MKVKSNMDITRQRPSRTRIIPKRYMNGLENYGVEAKRKARNVAKIQETAEKSEDIVEEVPKEVEVIIGNEDQDSQDVEDVEVEPEEPRVRPKRNAVVQEETETPESKVAEIQEILSNIDVEKHYEDRDFDEPMANPFIESQSETNVTAFLKACPHLNEATALRFLKENDLATSIKLGKQVQLSNQTPTWLHDLILSNPACLQTTHYQVVMAEQFKQVVSRAVFMEAALKAKGNRPIDHVQLLVDVEPEAYVSENTVTDKKKKYTPPARRSGSRNSSTSRLSNHEEGNSSKACTDHRRNGKRSKPLRDESDQDASSSALYSFRPKKTKEEVYDDSKVHSYEYDPSDHWSSGAAGSSTRIYKPIMHGRTYNFSLDQPSTSRTNPRSNGRQNSEMSDQDRNANGNSNRNVIKKSSRPSIFQGKKK